MRNLRMRIWHHCVRIPHKKVQENPLFMDFPELGGDEEDRTLDLTDANRTLSQLSYAPKLFNLFNFRI